jgi:hypothetical protein
LRSIRAVLETFLQKRGAAESFRLVGLWRSWAEVLGPDLASLARPLGHKGSRLILGGEDSITLQEITYFGPDILERVNAFLGGNVFDKISVELIRGRSPLDGVQVGAAAGKIETRRPDRLGGLAPLMSGDSAVSRCYRAYVRFFDGNERCGPSGNAGGPTHKGSRGGEHG